MLDRVVGYCFGETISRLKFRLIFSEMNFLLASRAVNYSFIENVQETIVLLFKQHASILFGN